MPTPKRSLEELVVDGLKPDASGNDNARTLRKMRSLTYTSVLTASYDSFCALSLLYRQHAAATSPRRLMALFLACYVICRALSGRALKAFQGSGVYGLPQEEYEKFVDTVNPFNSPQRNSMRKCIAILSLHPVYKDQGDDPF